MSLIASWSSECDAFQGDRALFWAGKMSIAVGLMEYSYPADFSKYFSLLLESKNNYDREILSRGVEPIIGIEV